MPLKCAGGLYVSDGVFELYDDLLMDIRVPAVLQQAAEVACRVLCAERSAVYLVREDTQELESHGTVGNVPQTIRIPMDHCSLGGHCAVTREAFLVEDAYGDLSHVHPDLRFDASWDQSTGFRTREVMCAPAVFRGALVGVVQVINSKVGGFEVHQLSDLESIGRLLGYALASARAFDDLATLKELKKRNSQFMRVMVHELKSPVAAARMMIDLFREGLVPHERQQPTYDKLRHRLDGMLGMIRDILDLSRVQGGDALGAVDVVDLVGIVERHRAAYEEQAQGKGIDFALHVDEAPLPVRIDDKGLDLVVSNLLSNAVKYTQEGRIEARLSRDGGQARLDVRDSGIGIPSAELPRLFQEFYRTTNARRARIEGTGVGLAAVKDIVERFGGRIAVESELGEGSLFTVRLPLSA